MRSFRKLLSFASILNRKSLPRQSCRPGVEGLEERAVPARLVNGMSFIDPTPGLIATYNTSNHGLTVVGTEGNDGIYVQRQNVRLAVEANTIRIVDGNGSQTGTALDLDANAVSWVQILGQGGNDDIVHLDDPMEGNLGYGVQYIRDQYGHLIGTAPAAPKAPVIPSYVYGGDGNDRIALGFGYDYVDGGAGDDFVQAGNSALQVYQVTQPYSSYDWSTNSWQYHPLSITSVPEPGKYLVGGDGNDYLQGSNSDDYFWGGNGSDGIVGQAGNDRIYGGEGSDWCRGGDGNDFIATEGGDDVLQGEIGNDTLYGGNGIDVLYGDAGTDYLEGGAGRDYLFGQDGNDVLVGGEYYLHYGQLDGNDYLEGGAGNDNLYGQEGDDALYGDDRSFTSGTAGNDYLEGGSGNDLMDGQAGDDCLVGDDYWVVTAGTAGDDSIYGGYGNDWLYGQDGNDWLYGQDGNDYGYGGNGNDFLAGGLGYDQLYGEAGNDTMVGGAEWTPDLMSGGAGIDVALAYGAQHTLLAEPEKLIGFQSITSRYDGFLYTPDGGGYEFKPDMWSKGGWTTSEMEQVGFAFHRIRQVMPLENFLPDQYHSLSLFKMGSWYGPNPNPFPAGYQPTQYDLAMVAWYNQIAPQMTDLAVTIAPDKLFKENELNNAELGSLQALTDKAFASETTLEDALVRSISRSFHYRNSSSTWTWKTQDFADVCVAYYQSLTSRLSAEQTSASLTDRFAAVDQLMKGYSTTADGIGDVK